MDLRRPSLVRRAVAWLALAGVLGGGLGLWKGAVPQAWSEGGVSYLSAESAFRRALRSKDPGERARAFEHLRGVLDARVVDAVQAGLKDVAKAMEAVRKAQVEAEKRYEAIIDAQHQAEALFNASPQTGRDLERYNKTERKLSKERDEVIQALKDLQNDYGRERSLENSAVLVLGDLLEALPDGPYADAHARLLALWRASRVAADVERWVAVMAAVRKPRASEDLLGVVKDEAAPPGARNLAIAALAERRDGALLEHALGLLRAPPEAFGLLPAAIDALRCFHDRRAVEPLIEFLAREDVGRLREDAHLALRSLTGETHGPYADPWRRWWREHGATFVSPPEPTPPGRTDLPKEGVTFYGIHTFSDRVLFVVDISGSMEEPSRGDADARRTKLEVARQELIGAVHLLAPTAQFNVIFFNHAVLPWQPRIQTADARTKKMLEERVKEQIAVGGTNLSDSLELGFEMAVGAGPRPALDTVFFMTDGKPTAGRFQDPQAILERVRELNRRARLRIHAIGVGADHDAEFLKELARIGDGQYIAR